ncbi:DUF2784 family protein [Candidatus Berkelbacteria bacterium]|nr:DUF2784 family protein [Candidatus Berkelbacteria bacterium]
MKLQGRLLSLGVLGALLVLVLVVSVGGPGTYSLRVLANSLTTLHLLWVLAIVLGAALALLGVLSRHPRWAAIYNTLVLVSVGSWLVYGPCLFTVWESVVRSQLGQAALTGGFLMSLLGTVGLNVTEAYLVAATYLVLGVGLGAQLGWLMYRRLRERHTGAIEAQSSRVGLALLLAATLALASFALLQSRSAREWSNVIAGELTEVSDQQLAWTDQDGVSHSISLTETEVIVRRLNDDGTYTVQTVTELVVGDRISGELIDLERSADITMAPAHLIMLTVVPTGLSGEEE